MRSDSLNHGGGKHEQLAEKIMGEQQKEKSDSNSMAFMNGPCGSQTKFLRKSTALTRSSTHLERGLNAFMSFSFCFSSIAVITSLCLVINFGLETGGPVVMVWGWIAASVFTLFTVATMGEICSVYPSAGSVYYWSGVLAPKPEWSPVLSYTCAWFNLLGNIASDSSFAFGLCQVLSAAITLMTEGRQQLSVGSQVILSFAILILWAIKNRMKLDKQGWFGNVSAIY